MKKAILALGLIAGALGATSAVAQDRYGQGYGSGYGYGYDDRGGYGSDYRQYDRRGGRGYELGFRATCSGVRANRLETRIAFQARRGDIDWRTARELRAAVDRTEDLQRRYCSYGLNPGRAREIDSRFDQIERRLRWEDRADWRR